MDRNNPQIEVKTQIANHVVSVFGKIIMGQYENEIMIWNYAEIKRQLYDGFERAEIDAYLETFPMPDKAIEMVANAKHMDIFFDEPKYIFLWTCQIVHHGGFMSAEPGRPFPHEEFAKWEAEQALESKMA